MTCDSIESCERGYHSNERKEDDKPHYVKQNFFSLLLTNLTLSCTNFPTLLLEKITLSVHRTCHTNLLYFKFEKVSHFSIVGLQYSYPDTIVTAPALFQ